MAMIDYGALLRVDGKLINEGKMFMDSSDTGYVCEKAYCPTQKKDEWDEFNNLVVINGNYFVYAGDEDLLICFYKTVCVFVYNNEIIKTFWGTPFASETFFLPNNINLKISHLDKELRVEPLIWTTSFEDYMKDAWGELYTEDPEREMWKYERKWFRKMMSKSHIHKNISYKYRSRRYLAEWDYKGKHYEVIFGYGIDSDKECWDRIKNNSYGFSDVERNIINEWFKEDK